MSTIPSVEMRGAANHGHQGILDAVGRTPIVRLEKLTIASIDVFAKLEMLNPGGSAKDRPAARILLDGLRDGRICKGTTIVESTSGNLGIGLAQACRVLGLRLICVVDTRTTASNLALLRLYGAEVEVVHQVAENGGGFLQARIDRVQDLMKSLGKCYWINQYANVGNALSHEQTMQEITTSIGVVDFLFVATSTCGTLRGCSDVISKRNLKTRLIAVDAKGSVIFGQKPEDRLIPGYGASRIPELYTPTLASDVIHISESECIRGCFHLLQQEAILGGGSTGAVVSAFLKHSECIPAHSVCALILCDRGERYLDTVYSDVWLSEHFQDHLSLKQGWNMR